MTASVPWSMMPGAGKVRLESSRRVSTHRREAIWGAVTDGMEKEEVDVDNNDE